MKDQTSKQDTKETWSCDGITADELLAEDLSDDNYGDK